MEAGQLVKTLSMYAGTLVIIATLGALHGCGGGDDGGFVGVPPGEGPAGAVGVFKDSNVAGLNYTSGTASGVTGQDGTFNYVAGRDITFKVGGLTLGTAAGSAVMTPIDLVAGGSSSLPAVQNMARLLMMLDADGDPDNGIVISAGLQTRAANWSQVNFADAGIDTTLQTLAAEARSADGGVHTLPTAAAARTHIETSFRCALSGLFRGTFVGAEQGRFGVILAPNDGGLAGVGALTNQLGSFDINPNQPLTIDRQASVTAKSDITGAMFTGQVRQPDSISGVWTRVGTTGGTFTGTRLLAKQDAVFRYSGFFSDPALPESGPVTFDVKATGEVTGVAYGLIRDQLIDFTGTLTGGSLNATAKNGAEIRATAQVVIGSLLQGTWLGTGAAGTFSAVGCKLN